jgi:hypothetical protein
MSDFSANPFNRDCPSQTIHSRFRRNPTHWLGVLLLMLTVQPGVSWAQAANDVNCQNCVDNSDIAKDTITSNRIKDGAVNRADIAQNAINSSRIKNGSVKREDIADGAVTINKLSSGAQQALVGPAGPQGADGVMYDGAAEGDMQYWNGNAWIMISAPAEDADSLSFCDGEPTWTQGGCPTFYEIGDVGPAGGWVFHITEGGLHGLEAAPEQLGQGTPVEWGCYGETVPGTFSSKIGAGAANTALMASRTCEAALMVQEYVVSSYGGWFLPSADELIVMFQNLQAKNIQGFGLGNSYWSSTQHSATHAIQVFSTQVPVDPNCFFDECELMDKIDIGQTLKWYPISLRPVRVF